MTGVLLPGLMAAFSVAVVLQGASARLLEPCRVAGPSRRRSLVPSIHWPGHQQRRAKQLTAGLAPFVDSVARSMRSGVSLRQALAEVEVGGQLGLEVAALVRSVEHGRTLDAAAIELIQRWPRPEVRITATALALAAANEAGAVRALDGVGASLRDLAELEGEIRALTAQARASVYVTAALPVLFFAVTAMIDPGAVAFLFTSGFGQFCLVAGLLLDAAGFLWMRRLVRRLA